MSNDVVIRVENLSKQYRIGSAQSGYKTFRETLVDAAKAPFLRLSSLLSAPRSLLSPPGSPLSSTDDTIWALKEVSFEVKRGEIVGIIGRNGAGKSTLLKVLSKITEPTRGRVELRGRVGSLLEVGTGFHSELTGHENVYLYGAILGMDRWEVTRKFDEIVAFAELEKFIETPVKRYSSGMYMRLAFAVAAHMETEILLVDEVLAVGDASFQKKCLSKMDDVSKVGRTVLFVSHSMAAVRKLCHTGVLMNDGKATYFDSMFDCINKYLDTDLAFSGSILEHVIRNDPAIEIRSVTINGSEKDHLEISADSRTLTIELCGLALRQLNLDIEVIIFDMYENALAFFSPGHERGGGEKFSSGNFNIIRSFELPMMSRGTYYLYLYITDPGNITWVEIPRAVKLTSEGTPTASGLVFDYDKGVGWVHLTNVNK